MKTEFQRWLLVSNKSVGLCVNHLHAGCQMTPEFKILNNTDGLYYAMCWSGFMSAVALQGWLRGSC